MLVPVDRAQEYYRLVDFENHRDKFVRETGFKALGGEALLQSNILVAPPGGRLVRHLLGLDER